MTGYPPARPAGAGPASHGDRPGGGQLAALTEALGASAERLLIGASVYREPADRNALLFQVGQHDWTAARAPDRQGPAPPYQEPADLGDMIAACEAAGLLTVSFVAPSDPADRLGPGGRSDLSTVFVDRWTASELHRILEGANRGHELAAAHLRAAEYWRWRSVAWPQKRRADLHDLLEARHHLLKAGETEQACELTEAVCSQLHAWGDLGREAALISDTLTWLPARSARSAAWIHELGKIAQVRADYAEAERCYQQALDIFAAVGDQSGVSRVYHSLGILAQAQGEYARAELRYQQAADAATEPEALALEVTGSAPASAAPASAGPADPGLASVAVTPRHASVFARPGRPTWWRMPGLTAVSAALLALSVAGITGAFPSAGGVSLQTSGAMTAVATVRQDAAAWVAGQVSRSAIVACDPAMCMVLQSRGVPAANLLVLGPAALDPLGSDVVVATSAVRSEFGTRLADVYAPVVLARFGAAGAGIEIRVVAPDGAGAYRNALAVDLAARRHAGAQLLGNPRLSLSASARRQLADGLVDSRLLTLLATLADLQPVRIISFGRPAPGADARLPLCSVDISDPATASTAGDNQNKAAGRSAARASSVAYLRSGLAFLRVQRVPYLPAVIRVVHLSGGQAAIRIGFASPSPLRLLPESPAMQVSPPS